LDVGPAKAPSPQHWQIYGGWVRLWVNCTCYRLMC
jgi:hypothetical protein